MTRTRTGGDLDVVYVHGQKSNRGNDETIIQQLCVAEKLNLLRGILSAQLRASQRASCWVAWHAGEVEEEGGGMCG